MSSGCARLFAAVALTCLAAALDAQSIDINPEFRRTDPFGAVVASDRGLVTREILSPAVARNGFASFHITVSVPLKEAYLLYVASNPLNACRIDLYKEHFVKTARGWVPDKLVAVSRLPDFGVMPDPDDAIDGQTTRSYLLDLWLPPAADVARFRVEVQLKVADWIVRPIEVRVMPARIPNLPAADAGKQVSLPPVEEGADFPALQVLRDYRNHAALRSEAPPLTVRGIIRRNALQDMALATSIDAELDGPEAIERRVLDLLWANVGLGQRVFGAEWYLKLRDYLYIQAPAR